MEILKRTILGLLILALLYLAFVLAHNLIFGVQSRTAPIVYERAAAAQELAADWASRPLPTRAAPPDAETLAAIESSLPPSLQGHREHVGAPRGAIAAAIEFAAAIGAGDPNAYVRWRESQGFEFLGRFPRGHVGEPMDEVFEYAWRHYRELPGNLVSDAKPTELPPREAFDLLFTAYAEQDGGSLRPVAVAVAPGAAEAHYKWATHADDHMRYVPFAPDGLNHPFWVGGTTGTFRPWFSYQRTRNDIIEAHGGIWLARVHLAFRGSKGHIVPVRLLLFHDPEAGWRTETWIMGNIGKNAGVTNAIALGIY